MRKEYSLIVICVTFFLSLMMHFVLFRMVFYSVAKTPYIQSVLYWVLATLFGYFFFYKEYRVRISKLLWLVVLGIAFSFMATELVVLYKTLFEGRNIKLSIVHMTEAARAGDWSIFLSYFLLASLPPLCFLIFPVLYVIHCTLYKLTTVNRVV